MALALQEPERWVLLTEPGLRSIHSLHRNERVRGKYQGRAWFDGRIHQVHLDGTLSILYDDGDFEQRVEPHYVRVLVTRAEEQCASAARAEAAHSCMHAEGAAW